MKIEKGTVRFWVTISIAIAAIGCMLSMAYFNPSKSLTGLLIVLVIVIVWMAAANSFINFLYNKENPGRETDKKEAYASSEAVNAEDELASEFHILVSAIAWHNAKVSGKLLTLKEADSESCPKEKLISPDDMEKAFWEAANLVSKKCGQSCGSCANDCDRQTLLQKIKNLRKKYEEKS